MAERIPHLTALRIFEAASRHMSFQKAAEELGLSPSAVSHQIRSLEDYLNVRLFERKTRTIALTDAGRALQPGVEQGFRSIEASVRQVRSLDSRSVIVVSVGLALAAKWLVPRLYEFEEENPGIEVRVASTNRRVDMLREDVDVGIRHGTGVYDGLESTRLFGEAYAPLCCPSLAAQLKSPADILKHRLLFDDSAQLPGQVPDWPDWLASEGLEIPRDMRTRHFSQADHAMQAAIDGVGILFGRLAISAPDRAAGRLVQPFEYVIPSSFNYFFVTRPGRRREKAINAFYQWLTEDISKTVDLPT